MLNDPVADRLSGVREVLKPTPLKEAVRTADLISAERNFMEVCVFARPLAELVAPPAMRHHAETSSTVIADLGLPHHALAQWFEGISLKEQPVEQKMAMFSPTIASAANPFASAKELRHFFMGRASRGLTRARST